MGDKHPPSISNESLSHASELLVKSTSITCISSGGAMGPRLSLWSNPDYASAVGEYAAVSGRFIPCRYRPDRASSWISVRSF
jgi:hypothetical protein